MIGAWLSLAILLGAASADVVFLKSGDRVEGEVVDSSPTRGVTVRLPDGQTRWFHPLSVDRIERAGAPRSVEPPAIPPAEAASAPPSPPLPEQPVPLPLPPASPAPAAGPPGAPAMRGSVWIAAAVAGAKPFGSSGDGAPSLKSLIGPSHAQLTLEAGQRLDDRLSVGIIFDFSVGDVGPALEAACAKYGTECSTATAQLGLFVRRDFAATEEVRPWVSFGIAREWLAGEVFAPYGGGDTVPVLSAPGWQFARLSGGLDWHVAPLLGLGVYATVATGVYERVTVDRVEVDRGLAVHGWGQLGVRGILGR